jgi:hypothetical protein
MITRFSVLPDDRKVLIGVDKANVFETGVVYEATKIMGEIILRPLGKYALPKGGEGFYPNENSTNQDIIESGSHLITQKEEDNIR